MAEPMAGSECEDINWFARSKCTRAEARRFCEEEWGRYDLIVRQGYIRELVPGDCPAHPGDDFTGSDDYDEDKVPDECRCYEIEEGWWDECTHRADHAVAAWRVEPARESKGGGKR